MVSHPSSPATWKKGYFPATFYTPSGCIGKVLPRMLKVPRSNPGCGWAAPIYTMHEALRGYCHKGGGRDQSIGSTVSDAIFRSWLWSTATRSSPLGYFSNYCKQSIINPTFCDSRFSTGRLLAIEDFTFLPLLSCKPSLVSCYMNEGILSGKPPLVSCYMRGGVLSGNPSLVSCYMKGGILSGKLSLVSCYMKVGILSGVVSHPSSTAPFGSI